ncbi:hypothetical protein C0971_10160 [Bacillus methanolicus]|uniref:hypothetical protein n=1 Tax=Bacillus methanolicus TaxID=1471 RepID=UPI00200FBC75|nr:hypothetical protein [Bacillus methanolicus]UQD52335.1 hypothetical protein C0971_10160 [Bacillus methanolicus]
MNRDQFLPQDKKAAIAEYRAAWTCIGRIEESIMKGDIKEAKLTIRDLSKSLLELERLSVKKQSHDRFVELIHELNSKGISAEMVVLNK